MEEVSVLTQSQFFLSFMSSSMVLTTFSMRVVGIKVISSVPELTDRYSLHHNLILLKWNLSFHKTFNSLFHRCGCECEADDTRDNVASGKSDYVLDR